MNEEVILRKLVIKSFHVNQVEFGNKTEFKDGLLTLNKDFLLSLFENQRYIDRVNIDIIAPGDHDRWVNSIMDIIPISVKALGQLGEGITHTLTGVYVMLTGVDTEGNQMAEFGSSEGILKDKIILGRAGTPDIEDYIIHIDVVLKGSESFDRSLPLAAHRVSDKLIQEIRYILKEVDGREATEVHEYYDKIRPNKKKILIVKQIAGQGAMYDNQLFPDEPSGFSGGKSIIDIGNVPIIMSPNEYRDGALRSMT